MEPKIVTNQPNDRSLDGPADNPVIPYFPTVGALRRWLSERLDGCSDTEAWRRVVADIRPRDLARALVRGANGQEPLRLSVAIEGGSSTVKRGHPEKWILSDHGRWPQMHLGALEAAYGTSPFYRYFQPEITAIFYEVECRDAIHRVHATQGNFPFREFTRRLFEATAKTILNDSVIESLRVMRDERPSFLKRINEEKKEERIDDLAFIDVIFRKGPEAVFGL